MCVSKGLKRYANIISSSLLALVHPTYVHVYVYDRSISGGSKVIRGIIARKDGEPENEASPVLIDPYTKP